MGQKIRIEDVLYRHAAVENAAVAVSSGAIKAFVVPKDAYMEVLGSESRISVALSRWRKVFDLSQYTKEAASAPLGLNTSGWNSSYTRQPLPSAQMRDWLESSVRDILYYSPTSILRDRMWHGNVVDEHCPPLCHRYVACDFSSAVLTRLRNQLLNLPGSAARVEVLERTADNFDNLEPRSFDTVIVNSVIQYFPDTAYLTKVIEKAVNILEDGGRVVIGDVLSLPLLPLFASSVVLFQAGGEMNFRELRERVRRRIEMDPQLIISPAYFLFLESNLANIER